MSIVRFNIEYKTNYGEELYICGSTSELGGLDLSKAKKLHFKDGVWTITTNIKSSGTIEYLYFIKNNNTIIRKEYGDNRKIHIVKSKDFTVNDYWKDNHPHSYLFTSVFINSIFSNDIQSNTIRYYNNSLLISIICPYVNRGQRLVLSGNNNFAGNWNLNKAIPLRYKGNAEWQIVLNTEKIVDLTEYKFVIVDSKTNNPVYWEYGANRSLNLSNIKREKHIQAEIGLQFNYDSFLFKGSGTSIPVFSLRSKDSFGIGDFTDLKKMVDWTSITNQQMIQLLPINDTTNTKNWKDSYPYNSISNYALHPIYLGLKEFKLKDKHTQKTLETEAKALNNLQFLDYEKVFNLKTKYTKTLFHEQKKEILGSKEFKEFYNINRYWLLPYSSYCYLRDKYKTPRFIDWKEYAIYDEEKINQVLGNDIKAKESFDYHCFIQFLLNKQLKEATDYAHTKGIAIKGDIPIGINRNSVEAWVSPHLFNINTQTGAPPDDFAMYGQNWGFPTYNWDVMEQERFDWWKRRFQKMADYFDAYRIDHILGFFRIWEIPIHSVQGLLGQFSPALPYNIEELNTLGFQFDKKRMTKPFIHESFLSDIFGKYADKVKKEYLVISEYQTFNIQEQFDTQIKIQHHFSNKTDNESISIRDGLYKLCNEVLFVEDRLDASKYHPRITAYSTYSYKYLNNQTKMVFDRIYEDFFFKRHNNFWSKQAMHKLPPLISSTNMLCCGEDLGMIPKCVPYVMNDLKILSLKIQRMPKEHNVKFSELNKLPYLSICTTSTHDMSPIRLWWEEDTNTTQNYYNNILIYEGIAPNKCTPQLCKEIIKQHIDSSSMWVILPLQDWMSISEKFHNIKPEDERINIPSNPNHYWRWRMHINLEDLINNSKFNNDIEELSKR